MAQSGRVRGRVIYFGCLALLTLVFGALGWHWATQERAARRSKKASRRAAPLSDDYLGKAARRLDTLRVHGTTDQRLHDLTQVVANLIDHLRKRRR